MPGVLPRALAVDEFFLAQRIHRLRGGIIIGIALAADRADCADVFQFLRRLVAQRGASARAVEAYRDAFELRSASPSSAPASRPRRCAWPASTPR